MAGGLAQGFEDQAAITLRNYLIPIKTSGATQQRETYSRVQSALVAFLQRRPLKYLRGMSEEQFLLPEEMTQKKVMTTV